MEEEAHYLRSDDVERAARLEAEAAQRRLALLAEISQFLLASTDYRSAIIGLARMVLPSLGDGCFISLGDDERARRLAISHVSPHKARLLEELDRLECVLSLVAKPIAAAVATGRPQRGDRVGAEMWAENGRRNEQWRRVAEALDTRAFMVIPLITRGRVLGATVFLVTDSDRVYTAEDLEFGQHVARRAAIAVDNLRLYEEAQQARQSAEHASRLKDEFLSTLSHELRTPLNAILGWARMLRQGKLDPMTAVKAAATIERNALAQARIVDGLLDVSKIITGSLRLNIAPVDVVRIVNNAIDAHLTAAHAKDIQVDSFVEPAGMIEGDEVRLQQVAWNLFSNAIKFTQPGGRVEVRLQRTDSHVVLTVRDNGLGISPDFLPHVFERFRQEDSTTTRVYGGLGLGLAIVRHLVELHGGTVEADSAGVGRGSTFTVRLPNSR